VVLPVSWIALTAEAQLGQDASTSLRFGKNAIRLQLVRIATWNVNSIKQRLDSAVTWLAERKPEIVCLQETKCVDDAFPREPFEALGYNLAVHGQKTFNGVAILSKFPFDEVSNGLPGDHTDDHLDEHERHDQPQRDAQPASVGVRGHPMRVPTVRTRPMCMAVAGVIVAGLPAVGVDRG